MISMDRLKVESRPYEFLLQWQNLFTCHENLTSTLPPGRPWLSMAPCGVPSLTQSALSSGTAGDRASQEDARKTVILGCCDTGRHSFARPTQGQRAP